MEQSHYLLYSKLQRTKYYSVSWIQLPFTCQSASFSIVLNLFLAQPKVPNLYHQTRRKSYLTQQSPLKQMHKEKVASGSGSEPMENVGSNQPCEDGNRTSTFPRHHQPSVHNSKGESNVSKDEAQVNTKMVEYISMLEREILQTKARIEREEDMFYKMITSTSTFFGVKGITKEVLQQHIEELEAQRQQREEITQSKDEEDLHHLMKKGRNKLSTESMNRLQKIFNYSAPEHEDSEQEEFDEYEIDEADKFEERNEKRKNKRLNESRRKKKIEKKKTETKGQKREYKTEQSALRDEEQNEEKVNLLIEIPKSVLMEVEQKPKPEVIIPVPVIHSSSANTDMIVELPKLPVEGGPSKIAEDSSMKPVSHSALISSHQQ